MKINTLIERNVAEIILKYIDEWNGSGGITGK